MTSRSLRIWSLTHKWTSLACTIFLLIICITGLPLVFREEIADLLSDDPPYAVLPADAPRENLDHFVEKARARYPSEIIRSIFIDDDEPKVVVAIAPTPDALPKLVHWMRFDARTGDLLKEIPPTSQRPLGFLTLMLRLHMDLFADLPGALFMGFMGLLFVTAIVSGVVLYAPFMRKLDFGTVRSDKPRRVKWLDLHNLLGVVTLAWGLVVGTTGVMNELSKPLFGLWQGTDVAAMLKTYHDKPMAEHLSSVQAAFEKVQETLPGKVITGITFPTATNIGSPHHYVIWTKGDQPLTSRLFTPVLIDAETGALTAVADLPWYLRALEVSRPLHFGDYGGMPLKIIWCVLDLITITVLGSGLYLWAARRRSPVEARLVEQDAVTFAAAEAAE